MKLVLFDGDKSIGGAKFGIQSKGSNLLLDFGLNFATFGKLFGEFLQPRGCRGLHDLWQTGLIPHFGAAYRPELFPSDFSPAESIRFSPDAVVVSHAHLDHMGLLGAIGADIPIVCSATTAMIMKSLQDTGQSVCHQEYAYAIPRTANGSSSTLKCQPYTVPAAGRPLATFDDLTSAAAAFWRSSHNGRAIAPGTVTSGVSSVGGLTVKGFPVDHSIPGVTAIEVSDGDTRLIYSADLRTHGRCRAETLRFFDYLERQPPDVLVVEGTRIGRSLDTVVTEEDVAARAHDIIENSAGRLVIADFAGRQLERLSAFLSIAQDLGRRLLISTKDAHLIEAVSLTDPSYRLLDEFGIGIYADPRATEQKWEQSLRCRLAPMLVQPGEVAADAGAFILAFSLWDMPEMLDLACDSAVYVYSSSEAYGEDSRLKLYQLWNWCRELRLELHGFTWEGGETGKPIFTPGLSASGHIDEASLKEMLLRVQAPVVVPVHTESPDWFDRTLNGTASRVVLADARGRVAI